MSETHLLILHLSQQSVLVQSSVAIALLITVGVFLKTFGSHKKYKFPPSPPGRLPLIGHSHLFPKSFTGDKAKEWGETTVLFQHTSLINFCSRQFGVRDDVCEVIRNGLGLSEFIKSGGRPS